MLSLFSRVRLFATLMDCSPPGSSVHGILQARILEWVAISYSSGYSRPRDRTPVPAAPALQADSLLLSHRGSPNIKGLLRHEKCFSQFWRNSLPGLQTARFSSCCHTASPLQMPGVSICPNFLSFFFFFLAAPRCMRNFPD